MEILRIPLLNANEDEVEVVEVAVDEGAAVRKGDLICVVESTKATFDVEAPAAGYVRKVQIEAGQRLSVGTLIAVITEGEDDPVELPQEDQAAADGDDLRATRKARELAQRFGVDLSQVDAGSIIKAKDVRKFLESTGNSTAEEPGRGESAAPLAATSGEQQVVVYGAGGHARVLIDMIRQSRPDLHIVGIIDDGPNPPAAVLGIPVLGDSSRFTEIREAGVQHAVLGIGAVTNNALRIELYEKLRDQGFSVPNLIHPDASVEPSVRMGDGNQIFAGAVVSSTAELGRNTIINSNVVVSHDCRIGAHTHLTPGAILAGGVTVGENTVVGMAVTIYLGLTIGKDVQIANGVNIMRDVDDGAVVRASGE